MKSTGRNISSRTRDVLTQAGWFPGRDVGERVQEWRIALEKSGSTMFPAAESALREFGGLRVKLSGPGIEAARVSFDLNPLLADDIQLFTHHGTVVGARLFPLGEGGGGHVYLAISDDGRMYAAMDELWLVGDTIEEGFDVLVLGKKWKEIATAEQ